MQKTIAKQVQENLELKARQDGIEETKPLRVALSNLGIQASETIEDSGVELRYDKLEKEFLMIVKTLVERRLIKKRGEILSKKIAALAIEEEGI